MKQVSWKKSCASVSSGVLRCSLRHLQDFTDRRKTSSQSWSEICCPSAVYESRLSITRELRPNGQTRPRWSNMNQYSVTLMPISPLKCFQNHLGVYCLAVKWESLWRGRHCEICWRNAKCDRSTANKNALSQWNDLWLVKVSRHGLDFLKPENRAMMRCRSLVFSQNTWVTICFKGYYEILAQWCQKYTAYCHFKSKVLNTTHPVKYGNTLGFTRCQEKQRETSWLKLHANSVTDRKRYRIVVTCGQASCLSHLCGQISRRYNCRAPIYWHLC